jgi:hypothetical protein
MKIEENKLQRWWLSFADPDTGDNLGVTIVDAMGLEDAVCQAHAIAANPGGQVLGLTLDDPFIVPDTHLNRLLSKDECRQITECESTRDGK